MSDTKLDALMAAIGSSTADPSVPLLQSRRVRIAIICALAVIVAEALRHYGVEVGDDAVNRLLAIGGALIGGDTVRGLGARPPASEPEPEVAA